jgi:hypothetical protein
MTFREDIALRIPKGNTREARAFGQPLSRPGGAA